MSEEKPNYDDFAGASLTDLMDEIVKLEKRIDEKEELIDELNNTKIMDYLPQEYKDVVKNFCQEHYKSFNETCSIFIKNYIDVYYNNPNIFYMSEYNYNKILEDDGLDEETLTILKDRYKEHKMKMKFHGMGEDSNNMADFVTIQTAIVFIQRLPYHIKPPYMYIGSNNSIVFKWENEESQSKLLLSISRSYIGAASIDSNGTVVDCGDFDISPVIKELPKELCKVIEDHQIREKDKKPRLDGDITFYANDGRSEGLLPVIFCMIVTFILLFL